MDFVYVEDVARANILAAKAPVGDEVFNVASGVETSLTALAQILGRIMGAAGQPDYGPARKVNAVPRRLAAINKGKRLLGFEPQVPLEEGLHRLVAWWQAQRLRADGEASVPGGL
jgi:UDP-glucose 4-epimerase